ncbi:MAG TPA: SpoIIE family protein phosphatase [Candidatus Binataceae bacterium]|nr:SpoIIE family protein phosphatase [Candidatus Binataceae bacterium]
MKAADLEWSTAAATMPGETESGDRYWAGAVANGMIFAVVDGLGHGRAAAAASDIAIATLERHVGDPLIELLHRCHESLRGTRGVAMSLAVFNTDRATLAWIGVGNVEGTLLRRDAALPSDKLLLRNGVVGIQLPILRAGELAVRSGDILTMATDGVTAQRPLRVAMDGNIKSMADGILARGCTGTDDALVLVARYRGNQS